MKTKGGVLLKDWRKKEAIGLLNSWGIAFVQTIKFSLIFFKTKGKEIYIFVKPRSYESLSYDCVLIAIL